MGGPQEHDRTDGLNATAHPWDPPALRVAAREAIANLSAVTERLAAIDTPSFDPHVVELDQAIRGAQDILDLVVHLAAVRSNRWRSLHDELTPDLQHALLTIRQSPRLHRRIADCPDPGSTRTRHTLQQLRREFEYQGSDRPAQERQRLAAIDKDLGRATRTFARHVLDAARLGADTDEGAYVRRLVDTEDRSTRERLYRAHHRLAAAAPSNNLPLVREILSLRQARARLVGRADFAELTLRGRTLRDANEIRTFLQDLRHRIEPAWECETADLRRFHRQCGATEDLRAWDIAHVAARMQHELTDFDEDELRPYFPCDRVVQGMLTLADRLLGVAFEPMDVPTWHPDIATYRVRIDGTEAGVAYLDLYRRDDKNPGHWMQGLRTDSAALPSAALVTSVARPERGPALLRHREVRALFHEFGHLLHHLVREAAQPGSPPNPVAWDFVEVPALLLEHWAWEREALDLFARHVDTGEAIPVRLYRGLRAARTFRPASALMRQLALAELDVSLHVDYDPDGAEEPDAFARRILTRFGPVPPPDDDAMVASFTHLFAHPTGYACGYYAYRWADVLAADLFTRFEAAGTLDRETGLRLRRELLAPDDRCDPMHSFETFMGRGPRLEPLLRRQGVSR